MTKKRDWRVPVKNKIDDENEEILSESDIDDSPSEEEDEQETPHEKRIRLTKSALKKARKEYQKVKNADGSHELLSERLKEEALLAKGKAFTKIASQVSGGMDQNLIIWDPSEMKVIHKLKTHKAAITAISFRRQSHMLFTADTTGRVCVWALPLTELVQDQGARTHVEILGLSGLTAERCVSCSGFGGPGISLWKVPEEVCVQYSVKDPLERSIECVYGVNDELFIGGSVLNKLYVWHSSRGSPVAIIDQAHPTPKLVPADDDPCHRRRRRRQQPHNWVSALTGLTGTDLIASGSSTGHVQLWQLVSSSSSSNNPTVAERSNGVRLEKLSGCSVFLHGFVNALRFTNDGRYLLVGLGQEHRLGKWEPRRPISVSLCRIPLNLPAKVAYRFG